jgi:hypothetical protein
MELALGCPLEVFGGFFNGKKTHQLLEMEGTYHTKYHKKYQTKTTNHQKLRFFGIGINGGKFVFGHV